MPICCGPRKFFSKYLSCFWSAATKGVALLHALAEAGAVMFKVSIAHQLWLCAKNGVRVRKLSSQIISDPKYQIRSGHLKYSAPLCCFGTSIFGSVKKIKRTQKLECFLWESGASDSPMSPLISRQTQQVGERLYMQNGKPCHIFPSPLTIENNKYALLLAALLAYSQSAYADLSLSFDDLITERGKVKIDVSLAYANSDRQGVSTREPIIVQTGATSFVILPTLIGESHRNSDSLISTLGLRYGLTEKAEIFFRASYFCSSTRNRELSTITNDSKSGFSDAWAGVNYKFKTDDETPALLGFAEIALREKHTTSDSSFHSAMLGFTAHTAIDPIVFSLTTAYRVNQTRKDGEVDYKPGNFLLVNPGVAFAANDRVTLTTGMQWINRQTDKQGGKTQGFRRTSSSLLLGVGYGISNVNALNITLKSNVSGLNEADLRLNWLHTF